MRLPLELMMYVCDILAEEDDIATLQGCALLYSQLTSHCQSLLFSHIALHMRNPTEPSICRLSEILRIHPELGDCIKSLHLIVEYQTCFHDFDLRSVLSRCTKVSTFTLESNGRQSEDLPDDSRTRVLEAIVHSPFLTKIVVSGSILADATFFARCHDSLIHLDLTVEAHHIEMPSAVVVGAKTKFLRYLNMQLAVAWCMLQSKGEDNQAIIDLSQLQVLSLAGMGRELHIQRLNAILQYAIRLERLSLRLYLRNTESLSGLLNSPLSCLATLRYVNLDLSFMWIPASRTRLSLFRGLFDELRRFQVHNALEDVDIRFRLFDYWKWTVVRDDWLLFATIFAEESFPCLKTVHVRTVIGKKERWSADVAAELANLPFGDLDLHFDFTFTLDYYSELLHIECKKSK